MAKEKTEFIEMLKNSDIELNLDDLENISGGIVDYKPEDVWKYYEGLTDEQKDRFAKQYFHQSF